MDNVKTIWRNKTLISEKFDDIYFSIEDGMEETRHVFLAGNGLPERWEDKSNFTIFETGFGTGLNFFVTLLEWEKVFVSGKYPVLHFVSVEKYPLSKEIIEKSLRNWPLLIKYSDDFLSQYNNLSDKLIIDFKELNVKLTIFFSDVNDIVDKLNFKVDAWYLDGFAPAKNPEMWSDKLFAGMCKFSNKNATFSTFTAAGFVKRALLEKGFTVNKIKGFGKKRDMLTGNFAGE